MADLKGRRVAVQFASPPQDQLADRTDLRAVTVLSPEEAMRDLAEGKADAAFIWGPSAGWIDQTALRDAYRIIPVVGDHLQWSAAMAFPREKRELRDAVDRALGNLGGSIDGLMAKYGFPAAAPARLIAAETSSNGPGAAAGQTATGQIPPGHKLFNENCAHCHGPDAVQGERRINLRLLHHRYGDQMDQVFMTTVTHGRVAKGMPNWSGILAANEFQDILAFLHSVQEP